MGNKSLGSRKARATCDRPDTPSSTHGASTAPFLRVAREELANIHVRLVLARLVLALLPDDVGVRGRTQVLRLVGFRVGHGTVLSGMPHITGPRRLEQRLTIGRRCYINVGCRFDLNERIDIGDEVAIGHDALFLTASHEVGPPFRRGGPLTAKPISIGDGAWLGARCVILPGVTVGVGAIVAAGAVVTSDVAPNTVVGGVPARVISTLPDELAPSSG